MNRKVSIFFILIGAMGVFAHSAYAYFPASITGSIFSAAVAIIPVALLFLGFLFFPIKRLAKAVIKKAKRNRQNHVQGRHTLQP